MRRNVVLVLLTLVSVTGCAASTSSTSSTTAAPSTTTATPVAWTLAQACSHWRTSAGPVAPAYRAMRTARTQQETVAASWRTVRDATGPYGTASREFASELLSPRQPWPTPLDQAAAPTASFTLLIATWADRVARATTEADFNTAWAQDPASGALPSSYTDAGTAVHKACPG